MVLSSSILFVAGNLQTLSTMASCSNDSLLMIARSLPAFAKQFGGDIERTFSTLISHRNRLFGTLRPFFGRPLRRLIVCAVSQGTADFGKCCST